VKVFVTGGSGLLGSHTIERLVASGCRVQALTRSEPARRFVTSLGAAPLHGTVKDEATWRALDPVDAIVHSAALVTTPTDWAAYERVNVEGTRQAVRAAGRANARLVHVSSVAVYGRQPSAGSGDAVAEDAPFGAIAEADYYARSKRLAEAVVWHESARLGVSAVALRPCVIYGERDRLLMGPVLRATRFGIAPLVGSGENRLAMVYVGNVVDALVAALDRPSATGPFNIANDGGFTQRDFYQIIGEASGRRLRLMRIAPRTAVAAGKVWHAVTHLIHPKRYRGVGASSAHFLARDNPYTSARAVRELGWIPTTEPHEALHRTVRWFVERAG
jgi:nucleoside-diphosphate-sugar epimerase